MSKSYTNIEILDTPNEQNHAARLQDVYDIVGAHMKGPVVAASTGNLNATYDSSGMTLTADADGALVIDGVTTLAVNDRVLIPNQTDGTENGIYVVTELGDASTPWVLTRADDFNATSEIVSGVKVHIQKGTSYADATFVLTTDNPILDTTPLIFVLDTGKLVLVKEQRFDITGDGTETVFPFTHGWNTRAVTVDLVEATGNYETVYADVKRPSLNSVSVTFGVAPAVGENFQAIVRAEVNS